MSSVIVTHIIYRIDCITGDLDDEALLAEKDHFDEDYDKDLDGFLNRQEIQNWVVPDVTQTANEEVGHFTSIETFIFNH